MGFLYGVLIVFEALLSALLIVMIFMQKTKGGMGGSAFGGSAGEAIFGSRMGNVLTKGTVVLGTIFLVNTIILTMMTARRSGGRTRSVMERHIETQPAATPSQPASLPEQGMQPMDAPSVPWTGDAASPAPMPSPTPEPEFTIETQQPLIDDAAVPELPAVPMDEASE